MHNNSHTALQNHFATQTKPNTEKTWSHSALLFLYSTYLLWTAGCLDHLYVQPIAFGMSFLLSHISVDYVVLYISFATFR